MLPAEDVLQRLASLLPDLHVTDRQDGYLLDSEPIAVSASIDEWATYPLIRRQPWFTSWKSTTQYVVTVNQDAPEMAAGLAEQVGKILQNATDGLLLDHDGFPWP
jgi:hypothetical protein